MIKTVAKHEISAKGISAPSCKGARGSGLACILLIEMYAGISGPDLKAPAIHPPQLPCVPRLPEHIHLPQAAHLNGSTERVLSNQRRIRPRAQLECAGAPLRTVSPAV